MSTVTCGVKATVRRPASSVASTAMTYATPSARERGASCAKVELPVVYQVVFLFASSAHSRARMAVHTATRYDAMASPAGDWKSVQEAASTSPRRENGVWSADTGEVPPRAETLVFPPSLLFMAGGSTTTSTAGGVGGTVTTMAPSEDTAEKVPSRL